MKYFLFLVMMGLGFTVMSNAQDRTAESGNTAPAPEKAAPADKYNLNSGIAPVPLVKGPVREDSNSCFKYNNFTTLTNGQSCFITNNEKVKTKLVRVDIKDGTKDIRGWTIESTGAEKIKDYIWLDYTFMNNGKSLATAKANCEKAGGKLPTYEELSMASDSGFFGTWMVKNYNDFNDAQKTNVRIRSSSVDDKGQSMSRRLYTLNNDPLVKVPTSSPTANTREGYDIHVCVIKKL